jgi:hypothetical protein
MSRKQVMISFFFLYKQELIPKVNMSNQTSEEVASNSVGRLAECHGEPLLDLDHSMWEMFNNTANLYPHRDAVVSLWQPPFLKSENSQQDRESKHRSEVDSVFRWSYGELQLHVELLTGWLQSQGCAEGQNLVSPHMTAPILF